MRAALESRCLEVELSIAPGEVLALLGANGAGKSTVLHIIAGLVRPDSGVVRVGERTLTDTSAGVHVETYDRRVGLLMQDPLLFPHLSAAANVAFGPRSGRARSGRGRARNDARRVAQHWLGEVDAVELADRMPRQLSGGQAQRVALARALAAAPEVLLLDEPMAGLDVGSATAMRQLLRRVLVRDGRAALLVTHELLDVVTLADRVVVLEAGHVVESGRAAALLAAPRSRFGARFAGVNLVSGRLGAEATLHTDWGTTWHGRPSAELPVGAPAVAVFSPASVAVYRAEPHGSPRNAVAVTVAELERGGPAVRVRGEAQPDGAPGLAADVTAEAAAELKLAPGERVYFVVKTLEVALHPAP